MFDIVIMAGQKLAVLRSAALSYSKRYALVFFRICFQALVNFAFGLYYTFFCPFRGKKLPAVKNDLLLNSATHLAQQIRSRSITSSQVVEAYIFRILEVNPLINAMVADRFAEARKEAAAVDRLIRSKLDVGQFSRENQPFLGVPFTVKECLQVKGLPNTSGSYYRKGIVAEEDADAVKRLIEAGAIPLGVTNVPELCMFKETYNKVYGLTRNPYNLSRTAGGSSGGEAALIASCGSPFGLGTDLGGSARGPAMLNGVFGHKPSAKLIPTAGQFPNMDNDNLASYSTVGFLCRYAEDLLPLLKVLAGPESPIKDWTASMGHTLTVHYLYDVNTGPLVTPVSSTVRDGIIKAVEHLRSVGATIVPSSEIEEELRPLDAMKEIWIEMVVGDPTHSFSSDLLNGTRNLQPKQEFKKWLKGKSNISLPGILLAARSKAQTPPEKRAHLQASLELLRAAFQRILSGNGVFLFPTQPATASYHYTGLLLNQLTYTGIFNLLGLPSTHVPLGLDKQGLPYGIQVVSNYCRDALSIAVAQELEVAFGGWRNPSRRFVRRRLEKSFSVSF